MTAEQTNELAIGDGVTVHLWTDSHAYTVIARTSKRRALIQRDM